MTMDLRQIEYFVRVVEHGSFSAAAKRLDMPKSSVSRGVAALERSLGVRLLQRTTRRLGLTEAGQQFYTSTARVLADLDEASTMARDLQAEPCGRIRITASPDVGTHLLAPVVTRFCAHYPGVALDVVLTTRTIDLVQEGFDLALRFGPLADTTLIARPLGELRSGLFASPAYLAKHGSPSTPADLQGHPLLAFSGSPMRTQWNLIGPDGPAVVMVEGRTTADNFEFLQAMVCAGAGIALLPQFVIDAAAHNSTIPALMRVLPDHATRGAQLNLVYPSARFTPKRVALFTTMLVDEIGRRLAPA